MRHWISIGALAAFVGLAFGSGGGEEEPVAIGVEGPPTVTVGQDFPCELEIDNGSDAAVIVDSVVVSADARRALGLRVPGVPGVPYGDDVQYAIPSVTVPAGGSQRVAMQGTPYLSGSRSHKVTACGPDGTCWRGRISTTVNGGADRAVQIDWTVPEQVQAGQPFEVSVELENVSGGPDLVQSVGFQRGTGDWLRRTASDPADKGAGDDLARTTWRYDLALEPGDRARITWTAEVIQVGPNHGKLTVCLASETFCVDEEVAIIATSVPVPGAPPAEGAP